LLVAGAVWGSPPVVAIYLVVALATGIQAVDSPSRTAIIPNVVRRERLPGALSLNFAAFQTSLIAGPALGGLVIARASLPVAYAIDVATYGVALLAVLGLPPQPPEGAEHEPPLLAVKRGLDFARATPAILGGFAMDLCAMVFGMPRALFPVLAANTFHTGPQGLGLLYSAPGVGAAAAALSTGWLSRARRLGRIIVIAIVCWGIAIIGFGFAPAFGVALLLLAVAGAADSLSAVCRSTIMQTLAPDRLRGRLSALYTMVVAGGPYLGDVEAGAVASAFNVQVSVVSGGILCLIGLGAVSGMFPAVWTYRQPSMRPVQPPGEAEAQAGP
jgi:MFS family permease